MYFFKISKFISNAKIQGEKLNITGVICHQFSKKYLFHNQTVLKKKKTSAMIYCIWPSICNKYVPVCEDMKPLLFWEDFLGR